MPTSQRLFRTLLALALAISVAGCTWFRDEVGLQGTRAVIVYARQRTDEAHAARRALTRQGVRVEMQVEGPGGPEASSLRVHDLSRYPERAARLRSLLGGVGSFEVVTSRPPDDPAIVLWLVEE